MEDLRQKLKPKYDHHMELCRGLNDLYARKNSDYGDSFGKSLRNRGLAAALVRMDDKYQRIDSLLSPAITGKTMAKPLVADEAARDTLLDLANYCLMLVCEMDIATGMVEGISQEGYEFLKRQLTGE